MIVKKTAFIIGAGASRDFGLPTGLELREEIIASKVNAGYFANLCIDNLTDHSYSSFCDHFRNSGINSIDLFLKFNPNFINEGKFAIAYTIKNRERGIAENIYKNSWIQLIYNKMIQGINEFNETWLINDNKNYFCTFNYDRILEHLFCNYLYNTFYQNLDVIQCMKNTKKQGLLNFFDINIDHVYGLIGGIDENSFENGSDESLQYHYKQIMLIKERESDVSHIINKIDTCERIFFLGYGFNDENNEILKLYKFKNKKEMYATGYGLFEEERNEIKKTYGVNIIDCKSEELLRRFL